MSEDRPRPAERSGAAPPLRAASRATAVGGLLPRIVKTVFERHGFPVAAILADWPGIAGPDFASFTAPERLVWPRRPRPVLAEDGPLKRDAGHRPSGATLVLRVDGPRALEVQHAAAQLIERINVYFGYAAVAQLRIIQGPVRAPAAPPAEAPAPVRPLDPRLDAIEDEPLRDALTRLAARVEAADGESP